MDIQKGIFRVLATGGDTALGSDDLDLCIAQNMARMSWDTPWDTHDASHQQHWIQKARHIKESLSLDSCTQILEQGITAHPNLNHSDIQKVILVGGSTRIPIVLTHLTKIWNEKVDFLLHPEYAVAQGAALQAYQLTHTRSFCCWMSVRLLWE